jgi:hypothetical protein
MTGYCINQQADVGHESILQRRSDSSLTLASMFPDTAYWRHCLSMPPNPYSDLVKIQESKPYAAEPTIKVMRTRWSQSKLRNDAQLRDDRPPDDRITLPSWTGTWPFYSGRRLSDLRTRLSQAAAKGVQAVVQIRASHSL